MYFVKVTVVAYIETWSNRVTREGGGGHGVEGGEPWISIFSVASPGPPISNTSSPDWIASTQLSVSVPPSIHLFNTSLEQTDTDEQQDGWEEGRIMDTEQ